MTDAMWKWATIIGFFRRYGKSDGALLLLIAVAYTALFSYFSFLRYTDFFTSNWDLGINQQMLWTTTHGRLLFETGDLILTGGSVKSFLQIHSTYLAVVISGLYRIVPYASTLFVLQSLALALSIVPLYLIAKRTELTRPVIFTGLVSYLLSFGAISALFYDFHWESLIPVEYLAMFYLFLQRKYALAIIPFILGCITLEVFPLLSVGIVLYFFMEAEGTRFVLINKMIHNRNWRILALFLTACVLIYFLIRFFQYEVVNYFVGGHQVGVSKTLHDSIVVLLTPKFGASTINTLLYWLLLYGSFAFIPIFFPKHFVLQLPWLYYTFLISNSFASFFGNQYAFLVLPPLALGYVFGLDRFLRDVSVGVHRRSGWLIPLSLLFFSLAVGVFSYSRLFLDPRGIQTATILSLSLLVVPVFFVLHRALGRLRESRTTVKLPSWSRKSRRSFLLILLSVIVLFNFVMSPLNVVNRDATPMPGYSFSYQTNPAYAYMESLVGLIPANSTLLASDNLFPFVANNPSAYSLLWFSPPPPKAYYPFNSSNLPEYVLFDSSQIGLVPNYILHDVFNSSLFGLRAFIYYVKYPGSIYLFERSYSGSSIIHYLSPASGPYYFYGKSLSIGKSGSVVDDKSSMFGKVIKSVAASNPVGNNQCIWYGPYYTFIPGLYRVSISLKGSLLNSSAQANATVLYMNSNSFETGYYYSTNIRLSNLSSTNWTTFNYTFNITEPYPSTEFRGYLTYSSGTPVGQIYLNYIEVQLIHTNQ